MSPENESRPRPSGAHRSDTHPGPGHGHGDRVEEKIEEARAAVQRYREKESPVPLNERRESERVERHETGADGSLLGEGESLERLGADTEETAPGEQPPRTKR